MLYRVAVVVVIDDPQEVKEALTLKLEELGFTIGGALVTVDPVEVQTDFLALARARNEKAVKAVSDELDL